MLYNTPPAPPSSPAPPRSATKEARHLVFFLFVSLAQTTTHDAGAASGGHLTFDRFASYMLKSKSARIVSNRAHGTRFETMDILVTELQCATKRLHATQHDSTFELAISTFSANVRPDPTTAAALSYSQLLALAAVGRGTSRASNNHDAARFRARRRDCGGGLRVPRGALVQGARTR